MSAKHHASDDPYCLTPPQIEILTFIRDYRRSHGCSPTLQEIADHRGTSKITVFEHVDALVRKGLLRRRSNKARSLELTSSVQLPDERSTVLPLVGTIAAGKPIEAIEASDSVDLESLFAVRRHPIGVLRVRGDSMIDEQIRDGDLVVFEQRNNPRNGETVVAVVDGDEATLKKFYKEKSRIRLQPANDAYEPIYSDNVDVQGVVIGVIRQY